MAQVKGGMGTMLAGKVEGLVFPSGKINSIYSIKKPAVLFLKTVLK